MYQKHPLGTMFIVFPTWGDIPSHAIGLTHLVQNTMTTIFKTKFQMHILARKFLYLESNFMQWLSTEQNTGYFLNQ